MSPKFICLPCFHKVILGGKSRVVGKRKDGNKKSEIQRIYQKETKLKYTIQPGRAYDIRNRKLKFSSFFSQRGVGLL
jgi:hypothetical protein